MTSLEKEILAHIKQRLGKLHGFDWMEQAAIFDAACDAFWAAVKKGLSREETFRAVDEAFDGSYSRQQVAAARHDALMS